METVHLACFPKDQDVEGEVLEDLVVQVCRKMQIVRCREESAQPLQ